MLNERRKAGEQVAERLFAVEQAIDHALTCAAQLSAIMPIARSEAKLSAVIGQDAIESAAEALTMLVRARQQIVTTHHRLDETKTQVGLRAVALGGGMLKPLGSLPTLSLVDTAAA